MLRCLGLLTAALVLAGAAQADDKDKEWKTFTSDAGQFSVSLPGKPKEEKKEIPTAVGKLDTYLYTAQPALDRVYLVSYNDFPKGTVTKDNSDVILENVRKGNAGQLKGELASEKKITLGK